MYFVPTPKAWGVLVAPVRLEVVEAMRMVAPCSIAEIAAALDRPADTLYRHIEKLSRAKLVVEHSVRRSGRRFEQIYDLVADDYKPGFKSGGGRAANKAYEDTLQSIFKIATRTTRDSARAGQLIGTGDDRNIIGKLELAWLTPDEFSEVRELMAKVKSYLDARKARRDGRLYVAAFVAIPVTRKRGVRRTMSPAKQVTQPSTKANGQLSAKLSAKLSVKSSAKSSVKSSIPANSKPGKEFSLKFDKSKATQR